MKESPLKAVLKQNYKLLLTYLFSLTLFFLFRFVYFLRFGEDGLISNYPSDFIYAFWMGIRFDTVILLYVFALVFVFNLFFFIKFEKFRFYLNKISKVFLILIISILLLFLIIDQQYFTYFQYHINIMVFGLVEDDTSAVLKSVWTDHPIFLISIIYLCLLGLSIYVINKIYEKKEFLKFNSTFKNILLFTVYLLAYPLNMRGSVGEYPLSIEDSTISGNGFINLLCQNGFLTFEAAIREHENSREELSNEDLLKKYGYHSINEALADYYQLPVDSFLNKNYLDFVFKKTEKDTLLEKNPPNVVFILAESFGSYYLNFHSKELNLLGNFEKHIHEDLFFNNFLSSTRGTIFSLEDIMMDRYYPAISDTKERFLTHKSCVAYPYSQAGYETIFISGGKLSWRNLGEMLPKQYFSEVYGQSVIAKNIKKTKMNTWGVYDEFLFEEIYRKLSEKSDKPKLIIALTTTNHTPYELPDDYKAYPINISDSINDIIISDHDIAQLNFRAYQYMNDQFGKFMDEIKSSDLAKNTIVGYSGDHNSYVLFPYESSEIEEINKHSVPFYLYVPDKLLKSQTANTKRYSSHKDIFPTLINLSLSEQTYFCLGDNLLDNNIPDSLFFGINGYPFQISDGRMPASVLNKKIKARKAISEYYFNSVRLEEQNKVISEN